MAFSGPQTPLCAIVTTQVHPVAVAKLLKDGADINKPCFPVGTFAVDGLPLDVLINVAVIKGTQNSPYVKGTTYSPERYRFLMGRISQFIDLGAQSYRGRLSMAEVESIVSDGTEQANQFIEQQRQQIAEEKRNSIFSVENLGMFVSAAGGVVNNYVAARNAQMDSSKVAATTPQSPLSRTTAAEQKSQGVVQSTPASAKQAAANPSVKTKVADFSPEPERMQLADTKKPQENIVSKTKENDGCVEAIGWCSTAPTTEMKNGNARLQFKNTCPFRVYGHFFNELKNGKVSSTASAVAAGGAYTFSSQEASGTSFIRVVGSPNASKDWVCYGKNLGGFTAGDSTLERR